LQGIRETSCVDILHGLPGLLNGYLLAVVARRSLP
jgi:hypothetical protein